MKTIAAAALVFFAFFGTIDYFNEDDVLKGMGEVAWLLVHGFVSSLITGK